MFISLLSSALSQSPAETYLFKLNSVSHCTLIEIWKGQSLKTEISKVLNTDDVFFHKSS